MSIDTKTKPKILDLEYKIYVRPDVLETIPEDPALFDALLKSIYKEIVKLPKAKLQSEAVATIRLSAYDKFENVEQFKTEQSKKNTAICDVLVKHKIITSYKLEFGTYPTLLKWWGQKDGMFPEVQMPYYNIHCWLVPSVFADYVTERFARYKVHFEELAAIYSRMIQILDEFFANPSVLNVTLNDFYKSLSERFTQLLDSEVRPTLTMEMVMPLTDLMLQQDQITRVTKDPNWLFQPMYDNYAKLQQFISMYDLKREQNLNFEQVDEYLENLKAARKQGLNVDGKPLKKPVGQQLITKLTLIQTETNASIKIILDDDYSQKPIKASLNKAPWRLLLRVAEGEEPLYQSSFDNPLDYLNTNTACKLYSNTGKNLTTILEREGGRIVRSAEVEMEVISSKTYQQRKNKLKSA